MGDENAHSLGEVERRTAAEADQAITRLTAIDVGCAFGRGFRRIGGRVVEDLGP